MKEKKYDAVVLFLFGKEIYTSATNTNVQLINRAMTEARFYNVPLIVPDRVPSHMCDKAKVQVIMFGGETICEYARNVKEDMARETWKNILVVAATPILDRCIRDLKRVYPGAIAFNDVTDMRRNTPYHLWFWEKERKFPKLRAALWFICEELLFFVPWPIYRWFALPAKPR